MSVTNENKSARFDKNPAVAVSMSAMASDGEVDGCWRQRFRPTGASHASHSPPSSPPLPATDKQNTPPSFRQNKRSKANLLIHHVNKQRNSSDTSSIRPHLVRPTRAYVTSRNNNYELGTVTGVITGYADDRLVREHESEQQTKDRWCAATRATNITNTLLDDSPVQATSVENALYMIAGYEVMSVFEEDYEAGTHRSSHIQTEGELKT